MKTTEKSIKLACLLWFSVYLFTSCEEPDYTVDSGAMEKEELSSGSSDSEVMEEVNSMGRTIAMGNGSMDKMYWNPSFNGGNVLTYLNSGAPTYYGSGYTTSTNGSQDTATKLSFADINGDGKADKIYWSKSHHGGNVLVFLATGYGYFSSEEIGSTGSRGDATRFYFIDVTGDSKAEKIYWNPYTNNGNVLVYLADGSADLFTSSYYGSAGSNNTATNWYFADVSGDNRADKIYWNRNFSNGNIQIRLANGSASTGYFSSTLKKSAGSKSSNTKWYFADVTGDGKDDKIYWNREVSGGNIIVRIATGNGYFDDTQQKHSSGSSAQDTRFYFTDVDGDGKADKIYWNPDYNGGNMLIRLAVGNGYFDDSNPISVTGSTGELTRFYFAGVN